MIDTTLLPTLHIATDHAGFELSRTISDELRAFGYSVTDHGPASYDPDDDYPLFCINAARAVMRDTYQRRTSNDHRLSFGIVIGGSGNGEQIAANKVHGIRAALVWNDETARLARQHNDANVISIGARQHDTATCLRLIRIFLTEPFSSEPRHRRRIAQIDEYEHGRLIV